MRIGLLTFHCAHNYGAVLQCYALQMYLKRLGHEVSIIDYRPKSITLSYDTKPRLPHNLHELIRFCLDLFLYKAIKDRFEAFNRFVSDNFRLSSIQEIEDNPFDVILIGSDQVWNYNLTNGFDDFYWGNFQHPTKTKIASYAASMHEEWGDDISLKIKDLLKNFNSISVREHILAQKLSILTEGRQVFPVVDPTLLMGASFWSDFASKPSLRKPYLLLFQVAGPNKKTEMIAKQIANRKKLKIVRLSTLVDIKTTRSVRKTSPSHFVGLFMYADFIVCSSFHGTVFSVIFNKPFISVRMNDGKDNRVENLLESLGLTNHFVDEIDLDCDYTYKKVDKKIEKNNEQSYRYLKNLLYENTNQ